MAWNDNLKGTHLEIAGCTDPRISVLAGPGTGKTSYAMLRSVQRVLEDGADPNKILIISFTRTAANDLRNKLMAQGDPDFSRVTATTLHSFAFGVLQSESAIAALGRTNRILLEHEVDMLIHDLPSTFGRFGARERLLFELLSGWDDGSKLHPCTTEVPEERGFERAVLEWLREHRAMIVGEVVSVAYSHLYSSPWSDVFSKYDHIYVDEYQDLNGVEQKLVALLAERCNATLMVVGDDDQSIYGFRNANPEGILTYHSMPDVTSFGLTVCGRCPENFVRLADYLIRHAEMRKKEPLESSDPQPGILKHYQWKSLEQEVRGIASVICEDVATGQVRPGKVLVLCNRRQVGKDIRTALEDLGVPAESFYGQEPLDNRDSQQAFSYLQLLANPDDAVALRIAVAGTQDDRRCRMWARLREVARGDARGIVQTLDSLADDTREGSAENRRLVEIRAEIRARLAELSALELPELVLEIFSPENPKLDQIRDLALGALDSFNNASELVDYLIQSMVQRDVPESPDFVRVMSLHKSKGLTADDVYITTAVEQVLPFYKASYSEDEVSFAREEGRRLLYVALTRAQRKLTISYPHSIPSRLGNSWGIAEEVERRRGRIVLPASSYIRQEMTPYLPTVTRMEI